MSAEGQIRVEGACFATDCVLGYEDVKRRTSASVRTVDDVLNFIRQRTLIEDAYSKNLVKLSQLPISCEPGSLADACEAIKGDVINMSVQRRELSERFTTDIYQPLVEIRNELINSHKKLMTKVAKLQKDLKLAEDRYRKALTKYDHSYRQAAQAVGVCRENGAKLPILTESMLAVEPPRPAGPPAPSRGKSNRRGFGPSFGYGNGQPLPTSSPSPPIPVGSSHKRDFASWLLPSDEERRNELTMAAQAQLRQAELCRRECRVCWDELVRFCWNGTVEFFHVINDYQASEELYINSMQDHLKKVTVFESSALANQQYDMQMLFKVLENISVSKDLTMFLEQGRSAFGSDSPVALADMLQVPGVVALAALPPPPMDEMLTCPKRVDAEPPTNKSCNVEAQLSMPMLFRPIPDSANTAASTNDHQDQPQDIPLASVPFVSALEVSNILKVIPHRNRRISTSVPLSRMIETAAQEDYRAKDSTSLMDNSRIGPFSDDGSECSEREPEFDHLRAATCNDIRPTDLIVKSLSDSDLGSSGISTANDIEPIRQLEIAYSLSESNSPLPGSAAMDLPIASAHENIRLEVVSPEPVWMRDATDPGMDSRSAAIDVKDDDCWSDRVKESRGETSVNTEWNQTANDSGFAESCPQFQDVGELPIITKKPPEESTRVDEIESTVSILSRISHEDIVLSTVEEDLVLELPVLVHEPAPLTFDLQPSSTETASPTVADDSIGSQASVTVEPHPSLVEEGVSLSLEPEASVTTE